MKAEYIEKEFITKSGHKAYVCAYPMGHRCGYIVLPKGHKYHSMDEEDIDIDVHGGITYSGLLNGESVIGFDCRHCYDAPDISIMSDEYKKVYDKYPPIFGEQGVVRTLEYCVNECEKMGEQLVMERVMTFEKELEMLINRYSKESDSNTPDFILAEYLLSCLDNWNSTIRKRIHWYNKDFAQEQKQ